MCLESEIQYSILDYLNMVGIFAFRINSMGVYHAKTKKYRKPGKFTLKGMSDIFAIRNGQMICIEVKSKKGRVSDEQKIFIDKINRMGGKAFVARSIDDVKRELCL